MAPKTLQQATIRVDGRLAPVRIRVNNRARRIILKVDPGDGAIVLTAPSARHVPDALAFARERADWISEQRAHAPGARPFAHDVVFPYRGQHYRIINEGAARRPVTCDADARTLMVGGARAHVNRRVTDWLKRDARETLTARADYYASRLGVARKSIRIRDTRSRWGSCSSDGALSFSWRLILAPPTILDYVAAHECAHLVHLDHSPAFWRVVKSLDVDAKAAASWFNEHGAGLFTWGVGES